LRLTIAIPTVDRAYCIQRAVESALAQPVGDLEVLVSNNASTDETRSLLDALCSQRSDPRLRVVHHEQRMPITAHAGFLIGEARGAMFLGLSDDDWIEPAFVPRVLRLVDSYTKLSFVYTRCRVHVGDLSLASPAGPELEEPLDFLEAYFAGWRQVYWCGCVTRTADLRRIGTLPSDRLIGDMYYWTKLALEGPVGFVNEFLAHYTYLAGNASIGIPARQWAKETAILASEVLQGATKLRASAERRARIHEHTAAYVARSTANQLALNAQCGMGKWALLSECMACARYLTGDLTALLRIGLALLLPPAAIRWLTRVFTARLASRPQTDAPRLVTKR